MILLLLQHEFQLLDIAAQVVVVFLQQTDHGTRLVQSFILEFAFLDDFFEGGLLGGLLLVARNDGELR